MIRYVLIVTADRRLRVRLHQNLLRLVLAQREIVAAHFDLDWIAHRCEADQLDFRAYEQAHFHQARAGGGREFDRGDGGGVANGNSCERLGVSRHGTLSGNRFDQNRLGEFLAEGHARVADLADHAVLPAHEPDALVFA